MKCIETAWKQSASKITSDEKLTQFQKDGVHNALYIIYDIDGVMIADSTGLGKTKTGIEILTHKIFNEKKRVLLIAPSQVLKSMWKPILKYLQINVPYETAEKFADDDILDEHDPNEIDVVLIDESQYFRNNDTKRYKNLMSFLALFKRKQVILMSATPINNGLMDLYNQISLITLNDTGYFRKSIGIENLEKYMKSAAKQENFAEGLEKINQLLDNMMVKRTRTFIKDVYKNDKINGRSIQFPEHQYQPIKYSISKKYGNVFNEIYENIKQLTMAPYSLEYYNNDIPMEERKKHKHVGGLQMYQLLKLFDSSMVAGKQSTKNRIKFYTHFKKMIIKRKVFEKDEFTKLLKQWNAMDGEDNTDNDEIESTEQEFSNMLTSLNTETISTSYDIKTLVKDIDNDLKLLNEILDIVDIIKDDQKIKSVVDTITKDKALRIEGKKVLIFTEFITTAKYITKILKEQDEFKDKNIECLTGHTKSDDRSKIIDKFAPIANNIKRDDAEIDILVSTEVSIRRSKPSRL